MLATGGGLLFVGRNDGRLTALDSSTGVQLWEFQTGAGMHAPVSTFEHEGRQYVIAYSAGNALIGSARGDSVWLFGLDGTLPPDDAGRPVSRQATPGDGTRAAAAPSRADSAERDRVSDAALVAGRQIYEQACAVCHGADGRADHGTGAPLAGATGLELAATIQTVTEGQSDTMPSFRAELTPAQIHAVSAYVVRVLAPRRPGL
jgi:mono/diheme cytochrome c family protein